MKGFTQARLLRRGWSRVAIKRNLGEPDIRRAAPPANIYSVGRVLELEAAGKKRFRRAPQRPVPDEPAHREEPAGAKVRGAAVKKLGKRQRSILGVLEQSGHPMELGGIVAASWGEVHGPDEGDVSRSFYESIRRAASELELRELINSEGDNYRRWFRFGPPAGSIFRGGRKQIPRSAVETKILQFLSEGRKRYSDVARIVARHLNGSPVAVCRAVKYLERCGKLQRILKTTPLGGSYELLELSTSK